MKKRILSMLLALVMVVGLVPTFAISTAAATDAVKVEHNGTTTYYENLQKAFDGFAPSSNSYSGEYVVTLLADTTGVSKTLKYPADGTIHVTLDLNGYTVSAYDTTKTVISITLKEGTATAHNTFTIKDSSGNDSGKITGGKGGVIVSGKNCTFNFEGGTITGNHGASKGGGINVGATTFFNMTGGVITGNSVTATSMANTGLGGGVLVNYGTISGGKIYGNAAYKGTSTNIQTARGGGVATEITRTKGYSTLTIANGTVYGNTAENAGDDVMAQGNGMSSTKWSLSIGTENWYIDGWNGKKATKGNGEADRYSAESPVAYTDGGFTDTYDKSLGLKYVAPAVEEEPAPAEPVGGLNCNVADGIFEIKCNAHYDGSGLSITEHYPTFSTNGEVTKNAEGKWTCEVTVRVKDYFEQNYFQGIFKDHVAVSELPEIEVFTAVWDAAEGKWTWPETPVYEVTCKVAPEAPTQFGENVTTSLVQVICDSDPDHEPMLIKWQHQSTEVRDWVSGVVWSDEYNTWIVPIRIDSIKVYYVWLNFEKANNDIVHELVDEEQSYIDTYLKWDADKELWVTLDEKPIDVHVTCVTAPTAPSAFQMKSYQIKVVGVVDGEEKTYFVYVDAANAVVGDVTGSREDGFTVDVTFPITEDDALQAGWIAQRDPDATVGDYVYDWSKTPDSITITLEYTGDLVGDLYGNQVGDWALANGKTYGTIGEAYVIPSAPAAPSQDTVVEDLVTIICDTDGERHESISYPWYPLGHCEVRSDIVWDDTLNAYVVDVKIGGLYAIYIPSFEKTYNKTAHHLIEGSENTIFTTLKWNGEKWEPIEPIELHTECQTAPVAPVFDQVDGFQVKVHGVVDGKEQIWTSNPTEDAVTIGEVYGSREEGFFVDITITITDGDSFITTWLEKKAGGRDYVYDWDKTPATVTLTLEYTGDLTSTLHGDRNASNTNVDWVLPATGKNFGIVADAYVVLAEPASPTQDTVTGLVTVICDTDGERHAPVEGKWYPQNCKTMSAITWNEDLGTYTVDVRVDSIEWYYVHITLERAYNNIYHDILSPNYVDTTLIWDPVEKVWAPEEAIEVHAACKTAPDAPKYDLQLESYQVKVYGDVNGTEKAWTTSMPEDGYTISEVYGSREEGFFVDVTITIEDGDIYQSTWIENRNPGYYYNYDWDKTPEAVTFTLVYNGDLNGTLYGDRHASNTNYDWVLETNGKTYGVVAEAYLEQKMETVNIVIYRNGDTSKAYKTVSLGKIAKGEVLTLSDYAIADYYENELGFEFYGWYNDGAWNQYKAGKNPAGLETITVSGWTNIICMVYDYEEVVVKAVVDGDTANAEELYTGKVLYGTNIVEWLTANVTVEERTGYTLDKWFNWDSGEKIADDATVAGATAIYVTYTANEYTISFDTDGGSEVAPITQFYGKPVSAPADPTKTGHTFTGWVREDGSAFSFDGYTMEAASFTLKATWKANTYSVTLVPNNGRINSGNVTEYTYGIGATLPTDVTRLGYKFLGWYDNPEFKGERVWRITETDIGDKVYFAKWELKTLPIIPGTYDVYVANSIKNGTVSVDKTTVPAGISVKITVDPNSGFELSRLTVTTTRGQDVTVKQIDETTYKFTMPNCDVVVDAAFTETVVVDTGCKRDETCPMYSFTDLDTFMWYHDGIHYCIENGLMEGYGNNIFKPDAETTRAMIVTILWRLEGSPKADYDMTFEDVEDGMWYTDAIRWAASKGIVLGYNEETFGPDDTITREQLATILYRYEKFHGGGFTGLWAFELDYVDAADVSDWAYEAMCWMTMNKIVQGKNDNVLDPQGGATRAEAATMLYRYCTKDEK